MQVADGEVEAVLLGKCLQWIHHKMVELQCARIVMEAPLIVWIQDPETDKRTCRISIRYGPPGQVMGKCAIRSQEPFDESLLAPPELGQASTESLKECLKPEHRANTDRMMGSGAGD